MNKCPYCDSPLVGTEKFCSNCGKSLQPEQTVQTAVSESAIDDNSELSDEEVARLIASASGEECAANVEDKILQAAPLLSDDVCGGEDVSHSKPKPIFEEPVFPTGPRKRIRRVPRSNVGTISEQQSPNQEVLQNVENIDEQVVNDVAEYSASTQNEEYATSSEPQFPQNEVYETDGIVENIEVNIDEPQEKGNKKVIWVAIVAVLLIAGAVLAFVLMPSKEVAVESEVPSEQVVEDVQGLPDPSIQEVQEIVDSIDANRPAGANGMSLDKVTFDQEKNCVEYKFSYSGTDVVSNYLSMMKSVMIGQLAEEQWPKVLKKNNVSFKIVFYSPYGQELGSKTIEPSEY